MNFLAGFTQTKSILGAFMPKGTTDDGAKQPRLIVWTRYGARLAILVMALFIFVWWPVDAYDGEGFDSWSERMTNLPDQVWYVLLGVIFSWGTTEVMAARSRASVPPASRSKPGDDPIGGDDDAEGFDNSMALDGRFSNVGDDGEDVLFANAPNSVIEEWRNNEAE